ncbi:metallopeptidase family protein [Hyphococcus sp.]|uniref:metallopeptidase family protein n=1 Tax=Hyphococcus sp. TaxID=2038636 RepID=UPI002082A25B|nr:MAG: acetylglutamate kinase [Marinicaulis sp.]
MTEPDLDQFDVLVRAAYQKLPAEFRALCGNVVIHTAEKAEPEILAEFGMDDPLELSGLFEGVELAAADETPPNHVHLYRRSILAELAETPGLTLHDLVTHVLVHEIGHHFGLSDEDMHAIEDAAE